MMYGFGDDAAPLPETVDLVEASLPCTTHPPARRPTHPNG